MIDEDRSILDFIDGQFTFVNGPLARHYGIKGVDGEQFQRVDTATAMQRSGIVTQGVDPDALVVRDAHLAGAARQMGAGESAGHAAAAAAAGRRSAAGGDRPRHGGSMRQRLEQHRANPAARACHNQMDPIGFGLENYDAAGRWRTKDGNFDIDSVGTLPDGKTFAGAKGLKEILRSQVRRVHAQRHREAADVRARARAGAVRTQPAVEEISRQAAAGDYKFSRLVLGDRQQPPVPDAKGHGGRSA